MYLTQDQKKKKKKSLLQTFIPLFFFDVFIFLDPGSIFSDDASITEEFTDRIYHTSSTLGYLYKRASFQTTMIVCGCRHYFKREREQPRKIRN